MVEWAAPCPARASSTSRAARLRSPAADTLKPGLFRTDTIEALTVNALQLSSGANMNVYVGGSVSTPGGTAAGGGTTYSAYHDYVDVQTGNLNLNGAALTLSLPGTGYTQGNRVTGAGAYITIVHVAGGSLTGNFGSLTVDGQAVNAYGPNLYGAGATEASDTTFWISPDRFAANGEPLVYNVDPWSFNGNPNPPPTGGYDDAAVEWWLVYNVNATAQPGSDVSGGFQYGLDGNDVVLTNVPEPSTIVMLVGAAVMGVGGVAWRQKRHSEKRSPEESAGTPTLIEVEL